MINYNNKLFRDYIEVLYDIIKNDEWLYEEFFPHSFFLYGKIALNTKFPEKNFSIDEVRQIIEQELTLKNITWKIEDLQRNACP